MDRNFRTDRRPGTNETKIFRRKDEKFSDGWTDGKISDGRKIFGRTANFFGRTENLRSDGRPSPKEKKKKKTHTHTHTHTHTQKQRKKQTTKNNKQQTKNKKQKTNNTKQKQQKQKIQKKKNTHKQNNKKTYNKKTRGRADGRPAGGPSFSSRPRF